jgi:hypothetical protein
MKDTTLTPDGLASVRRSARAIRTRFLPPTPARGARVKAWLTDDLSHKPASVTLALDYGLDQAAMHEKAALACLAKLRSLKGYECWCRKVDMVQTYIGKDEYAFAMSFATAGDVTLDKQDAADCLRLLDDLAAYALDGWVENGDFAENQPEEYKQIAEALDRIRHKCGGIGCWTDARAKRG